MSRSKVLCVCAVALFILSLWSRPVSAADYNITLITDNAPDYTDMQSYIWSVTSRCTTDKDKVLALFRAAAQGRRQTEPSSEHGYDMCDPILFFNSYGNTLCSIISGMNCQVWQNMGYGVMRWDTSAHSLSEVYYGGAWHWIDNSLTMYFLNHAGEIASIAEMKAQSPGTGDGTMDIALNHYGPEVASCPDGWCWCSDYPTGRTLLHYGDTYAKNAYKVDYTTEGEWGHRYTLNLRPYEYYTRYWAPMMPRNDDVYRPLAAGGDPDATWDLYNICGNGRWILEPDLTTNEYRKTIYDETNIESFGDSAITPNLHPTAINTPASVIFKVYGANIITSATVDAVLYRANAGDIAKISVSGNNGIKWTEVYNHIGIGNATASVHFNAPTAGTLEYLVKVDLQAAGTKTDAGLASVKITTITQLNKRTLPPLKLGTNRVQLTLGDQAESILIWPELMNNAYKNDIVDEANIYCSPTHPGYFDVIMVGNHNVDCYVTYKIDAPTDITKIHYGGRFYNRSGAGSINSHDDLRHSFDGTSFTQDATLTEIDAPWDDKLFVEITGGDIPASTRSAWLKYNFWQNYGIDDVGHFGDTGAFSLLMRVNHQPRFAGFTPIEVTYNWTEHRTTGDVTRQHTALVSDPAGSEWNINVAGFKDPTMNWVRVNLQGQGPDGASVVFGYLDGIDVGTGYERALKKYTWGTNLAQGKTYTVTTPSMAFNPDTGGVELTDGMIGGQAPGSYGDGGALTGMSIWDNGLAPEFTVDLGSTKSVKGLRAFTGANDYGWGLAHPHHIDFEVSTNNITFTPVGTVQHDQLWDPPGDYIAWEHDDSPAYDAWPQKGRVLYGYYLVLATPVNARYIKYKFTPYDASCKISLWELQAFDTVTVQPWDSMLAMKDITAPTVDITTAVITGTVSDNVPAYCPREVFIDGTSVPVTDGDWVSGDVTLTGSPISIQAADCSGNTRVVELSVVP
jgi:hypothetical protein